MKKKPKLPMKRAFWLKNLFLTACLLLAATPSFSQNKTVTGTVTDATGEPLIGASVLQQGTSNGVITNIDGEYSIQVPPEAILEFSYVGMVKQSIKVGNRSVIDVQMHDDSQMLAETVVIGYGSAKKRDLTGSITNIKGDEIANKPVVNPVAALQGKIAGVQVINSGKAGADPEIRVRGTNSINGYKPLYVVDGLFNDNINFLNPQDIESMEILKDPSSLAIFGVRGANGVIIITTKKAKEGQTLVNINTSNNCNFHNYVPPVHSTFHQSFISPDACGPFDFPPARTKTIIVNTYGSICKNCSGISNSIIILIACENANRRLAKNDPKGFHPPKIVAASAIYPLPATISFTNRLL